MLRITLADGKTSFEPGTAITGTVAWDLPNTPSSLELNLCWGTAGKGTTESRRVTTVTFDRPTARDQRPFSLLAPTEPYSFSGKLISLFWTLELVATPGDDFARTDLVIAPNGEEISLPELPAEPVKLGGFSFKPPNSR